MDTINEIINGLCQSTISNDIEWKLSKSIFNSDTQKEYVTTSLDGETKFSVQIRMESNFKLDDSGFLLIINKDLVDGQTFVFKSKYPEVKNLQEAIYNKYIKPNITNKNDNDTYKSILSNIFSKQHKRDQRIDAILGDENKPLTVTESTSSETEKSKSILNRLFGK